MRTLYYAVIVEYLSFWDQHWDTTKWKKGSHCLNLVSYPEKILLRGSWLLLQRTHQCKLGHGELEWHGISSISTTREGAKTKKKSRREWEHYIMLWLWSTYLLETNIETQPSGRKALIFWIWRATQKKNCWEGAGYCCSGHTSVSWGMGNLSSMAYPLS